MRQGRPRDEDARRRILDATLRLIGEHGPAQVRIDAVASAAGVGKQTIYRWWPTKTAVVLDAFVERTMAETPFPSTCDTRADLRAHMLAVVRLFGSPTGAVIRELVAGSQADPAVAEEFRTRFWQPRRNLSAGCIRAGIERGQVRADLPIETTLDALYGVLWMRLLIGHGDLGQATVDEALDVMWPGMARSEAIED